MPPAVISMANGPPLAALIIRDQMREAGFDSEIFDANVRFLRKLSAPEISEYVLSRIDDQILRQLNRTKLKEDDLTELGRELTLRFYEQHRSEADATSRLGIEWAGICKYLIDDPHDPDDHDLARIINRLYDELAEEVLALQPDSLGFTALFHFQFGSVGKIARRLRKMGFSGPMIIGGAATKLSSKDLLSQLLEETDLDLVYPHDMHQPQDSLIHFLKGYGKAEDIPGTSFRDGHNTEALPQLPATPDTNGRSEQLVGPLTYALDKGATYFPERIFPVLISEGCYWGKCDFCDYPYLASRDTFIIRATFRNPHHVVDDIKTIHESHGVRHIDLISDAIPPGYFKRLEQAGAAELGGSLSMECSIRAESQIQLEHFRTMKLIGVEAVTIGVEALSDEVLAGMKKGNTFADIERSIKLAREAGIAVKANLIVDHPRIRADHVPQMTDRLLELEDDLLSIGVHHFSLSPFAPMAFEAKEAGISINPQNDAAPSDHGLHTLKFERVDWSDELATELARFNDEVQKISYKLDRVHGRLPCCDAELRLPLQWDASHAVTTDGSGDVIFRMPGNDAPFEFFQVSNVRETVVQ